VESEDSGEDFEYYDEEDDEGQAQTAAATTQGPSTTTNNGSSNFDLIDFISKMDIPQTQSVQPKAQPAPSNLSMAGTKALDDLFSFDAPTTST